MRSAVDIVPGELLTETGDIVLNDKRRTVLLDVVSVCDRPIQVNTDGLIDWL